MNFYCIYSLILAIATLKAVLFYILIQLVTKIDLAKPFSNFVSKKILDISYYTFSIGLLGFLGHQTTKNMHYQGLATDSLKQFWNDSGAFILMAAVIYIIATIFAKGVEIQHENDLTV